MNSRKIPIIKYTNTQISKYINIYRLHGNECNTAYFKKNQVLFNFRAQFS